jgi:hypothetical protein
MFTAANAITLFLSLLAVAATWGALVWRVGRCEKDVDSHAKRLQEQADAREKQGKRIGVVEGKIERLFERTEAPQGGERRRRSTLPAIPAAEEGSDE